MSKVLIVEDDREINDLLGEMLKRNKYEVCAAFSGLEAMDKIKYGHFDIVLLDLMLPYMSGDRVLEKIREQSEIPVLVISAKESTQIKIDLLRLGADDYITKPFDMEEILARIESNLRRYKGMRNDQGKLIHKDLVMDLSEKSVAISGIRIDLTAIEFKLLEVLLRNPTKVFSKTNLFESVWEEKQPDNDNTLNVHMSRLRQKLKKVSSEEYIQTLWGLGYRISK
ncbi:response regulator transcription factor [Candidatus Ventrimonas sp. KK005]|nr:response regulator transcription factor [Lachnospiraceae bacterium]